MLLTVYQRMVYSLQDRLYPPNLGRQKGKIKKLIQFSLYYHASLHKWSQLYKSICWQWHINKSQIKTKYKQCLSGSWSDSFNYNLADKIMTFSSGWQNITLFYNEICKQLQHYARDLWKANYRTPRFRSIVTKHDKVKEYIQTMTWKSKANGNQTWVIIHAYLNCQKHKC